MEPLRLLVAIGGALYYRMLVEELGVDELGGGQSNGGVIQSMDVHPCILGAKNS